MSGRSSRFQAPTAKNGARVPLRRFVGLSLLACSIAMTSGCSWFSKDDDSKPLEDPTATAAQLYDEASSALRREDYETAIKKFETLEGRYPFGGYTEQAQLEVAYAYYKYNEPDSAIAAADRYIQLHPRGKHVDYALYLKGLANMDRGDTLLNKIVKPNFAYRDQSVLENAYQAFLELVRRFPKSRYVDDASVRMVKLRDYLAQHEIYVARYYIRRGAWVAAANRAQYALSRYNGSTGTIPALKILIQAYDKLGLKQDAADAREVLKRTVAASDSKADQDKGKS